MWYSVFYRFPRLTALIGLLIVAGGAAALLVLGRQEDPTLIERYGRVVTIFPGADAERVEALITEPLERALQELPEISEIRSISRGNVSQIRIEIDERLNAREVDEAWTLIRQKVEQSRSALPQEAGTPEVFREYIGATTLVASLVWTGEGEAPLVVMRRLAQELETRFQNLDGTELTRIYGAPSEEIRVEFDVDALSAAGLNLRQAADLILSADAKVPAGELRGDGVRVGVEVDGSFETLSRVRAVPLIQRADGINLRVGDLANVRRGMTDPPNSLARVNADPAIHVGVFIAPGRRVDQWATSARDLVQAFSDEIASDIEVRLLADQSQYTEARLSGLSQNLAFAALIIVVVLFLLMGWRGAVAVGMALPLTMCLALILFNLTGVPLHQMSVTGLIIALGLLIDNAIVVADEYEQRRRRDGLNRIEAIETSLKHLTAPLFASTLTTALAFAPIAMSPGATGEFIGAMGLSVIYSVTGSFFVAMTIVPALSAWLDRSGEDRLANPVHRWWRDGVKADLVTDGYRWTLDVVLRFKLLGILLGLLPAALGFWIAGQLPLQFFPSTERDQIQLEVTLPSTSAIGQTVATTERMTADLLEIDGVDSVIWTIGESTPRVYYNVINDQPNNPGFASGWVQFDDTDAARRLVTPIQEKLRRDYPEAQVLALPFEQGPPVDAPILFDIVGPNLDVLDRLGNETRRILADLPGVNYSRATLQTGAPTLRLVADEVAADRAGERLTAIAGELSARLEGLPAGSVLEGVEDIPVRVTASAEARRDSARLGSTTIGDRPGELGAPLSALGSFDLMPKTAAIARLNGQRVNTISAFLEPFTLPAPVMARFNQRLGEANLVVPANYEIRVGGEAEARGSAVSGLIASAIPLFIAMAGAVMLVFNSIRSAAIILFAGALSIFIAFIGVGLFGLPMGFTAIVGALGLFGLAINGSIVVLTALKSSPEALAGDRLAQREVIVDATRHIVATTLTTMGGFVPLILSGDPFWLPLATAIAVGVFGSALLALYFAPALFLLGKRRAKAARTSASATDVALATGS